MHEVALMQGVVSTVVAHAQATGATKITRVVLVLGAAGHLTEDGARQHFAMLAAGTCAEDAQIAIEWVPATFRCFECLHTFSSIAEDDGIACPHCGGSAMEIAHEDVCYAREITVEDLPAMVD
jgi:hydrogenase nickel incorporation protein HypA/HybF